MRVRIGVGALLALVALAAAPSESKAARSERIEVKQVAPAPIVVLPTVEVAIVLRAVAVEAVRLTNVTACERADGGSVERTPCAASTDSPVMLNHTLNGSAVTLMRYVHASPSHARQDAHGWRGSLNARGRSPLTG